MTVQSIEQTLRHKLRFFLINIKIIDDHVCLIITLKKTYFYLKVYKVSQNKTS